MSDCTQQLGIIFIIYFLERDATASMVNAISSYAGELILGNRICIKLTRSYYAAYFTANYAGKTHSQT